jgi:hypothetical protein
MGRSGFYRSSCSCPGVMLLSYAVMRLFGHALPTLEIDFRVLLTRCHALCASLILGVVWRLGVTISL